MTLRVIKNNRVKGKKIGFDPTKSGQLAGMVYTDIARVFSISIPLLTFCVSTDNAHLFSTHIPYLTFCVPTDNDSVFSISILSLTSFVPTDNVRVFSTSGCRLSNTLLHRTVNRHRQIKGGAADYQDNEVDASDDTGVRGVDLHIQMDGKPKPQKEVDTFK